MGKRRLNNWRGWLQTVSLGLLIVAGIALVSETVRRILLGVAFGAWSVYLLTDAPESRKWFLRSLVPIAAFVLLAVLFSFDRTWVFLGVLGIWAGITVWEFYAEFLAQRDRRQRLPESN